MQAPQITAYLKTYCGWSEGVRAIFRKYDLAFEEKDIIKNPAFRWEMEQKSGQPLSPCVEINGTMLPDISGAEVEAWMTQNGLLTRVMHPPMRRRIPPAPMPSTPPWPPGSCRVPR
jgi:glutaredoxin-related protein